MSRFSLAHLTDGALLRELAALVATDRTTAALLLAHLAEVDTRRLYAPRGYASMWLYCVGELKLAPDVAAKRIQAARAVREFPALLDAVEDGRLNVSAVVLLAPHLAAANFDELLAAVAGQSQQDIKAVLAHHVSGRRDGADSLDLAAGCHTTPASPVTDRSAEQDSNPVAPSDACELAMAMVPLSPAAPAASAPLRFPLHASVTQATRDKLAYARDLLGHAVPGGEVAEVLDRALDALIEKLEKRRFAATARTRTARRGHGANERSIPAAIRRAVWRRDGGHCTFVGDTGHRCESRHRLQFDHIVPVARGGLTTAANLRLRCHTHNQLEAERTFGRGFMQAKRERAASKAALPQPAWQQDVLAALRTLGFRDREARGVLAACELGAHASLEQRVRAALRQLAPPASSRAPAA